MEQVKIAIIVTLIAFFAIVTMGMVYVKDTNKNKEK